VKAIVLRHHVLDVLDRVPRSDGEAERVRAHLLVLAPREGDRLGAIGIPALAKEIHLVEGGSLADVLDSLVDLAEQRLVPGDASIALLASFVVHRSAGFATTQT
jgi:hypothetical protein